MEEFKLSRRIFLKSSGGAAAAVGATGAALLPASAEAAAPAASSTSTTLNYPKRAVGKAGSMPVNKVVTFAYPDASSPCVAIRMGSPVAGGVGPNSEMATATESSKKLDAPIMPAGAAMQW